MTKEDFVELCKVLLPMGAVDVSMGVYRATFRPPQPVREPRADDKPTRQTAPTPDQARHQHYKRVMGEDE